MYGLLNIPKILAIANNDYPPSSKPKDPAERLMRIKGKTEVDYEETQSKLIKVLDGIVKDKKLQKSKELQYFIDARERFSPGYRVENGRLIKEDNFRFISYPHWFEDLARDFIDFLSNPETDYRKIKKCDYEKCGKFYVAGKLDPRQKWCSDKCRYKSKWPKDKRREYQKKYRMEQKIAKEKKRLATLQEEVKRIMKLGFTRKEATEMARENLGM